MLLFILSFIILFCKAKCAILKCVAPFGGEFLTRPDFTLKIQMQKNKKNKKKIGKNNHSMISGERYQRFLVQTSAGVAAVSILYPVFC